MTNEERAQLIDQLDRSFLAMPTWAQRATLHAMAAPRLNPETGLPFASFLETISATSDESLLLLKNDLDDNGDLLPLTLPLPSNEQL